MYAIRSYYDAYQVFNIIQCTASGGNLVAVNSVGSAFSPILPTAFTQVVLTASSSATTQNQEALEAAAFDGGVAFDPTSANTGTGFPIGTREFAVNNLSDVHAISQTRGLRKVFVISDRITSYNVCYTKLLRFSIFNMPQVSLPSASIKRGR